MREIKFKAWHKREKKMYLPLFVVFTSDGDTLIEGNSLILEFNGDEIAGSILNKKKDGVSQQSFISSEIILLQFTGLKDKNGKEIYEGDIVRQEFIKYRKPVFLKMRIVKFNYKHRYSGYGLAKETTTYKVIGNIYENPELLKEKKEE